MSIPNIVLDEAKVEPEVRARLEEYERAITEAKFNAYLWMLHADDLMHEEFSYLRGEFARTQLKLRQPEVAAE